VLDDDEKFLRNYILGDQWKVEMDKERELTERPSYNDILGQVYKYIYMYVDKHWDKYVYIDIHWDKYVYLLYGDG
jgi:hypothetical protein